MCQCVHKDKPKCEHKFIINNPVLCKCIGTELPHCAVGKLILGECVCEPPGAVLRGGGGGCNDDGKPPGTPSKMFAQARHG